MSSRERSVENEKLNESVEFWPKKRGRKRIIDKRKYFSYELVYDDPEAQLIEAPRKKLRPGSNSNHTIADFLVYGDDLSWGFSDKFMQEISFQKTDDNDLNFPKKLRQFQWTNYLVSNLLERGLNLVDQSFIGRTTLYNDYSSNEVIYSQKRHVLSFHIPLPPTTSKSQISAQSKPPETKRGRPKKNAVLTQTRTQSLPPVFDSTPHSRDSRILRPRDFNGEFHFGTVFSCYTPLWTVFFLGTNDLKTSIRKAHFEAKGTPLTAEIVANNVTHLALQALSMYTGHCHFGNIVNNDINLVGARSHHQALKIVIIVPPRIIINEFSRKLGFDEESERISKELPEAFFKICKQYGFIYVYRKLSMKSSSDGVHMTRKSCKKLGKHVWQAIRQHMARSVQSPKYLKH